MINPHDLFGKKAPSFCLKNSEEKEICLNNFAGKKVILYFYPKDNTPGCTLEAIEFTSTIKKFEEFNTAIIGISKDSCASHKKFAQDKNLLVMLLSDSESKIQKEYGVWQKKKFMGREYMGASRTTFLIDETGTVIHVWENVSAKGHAKNVLEKIKGMEKNKE